MKVILAREACRSVTCKQKIQEEIKTSAVVHKHDHAVASINCIHYHVCYTHYYVCIGNHLQFSHLQTPKHC